MAWGKLESIYDALPIVLAHPRLRLLSKSYIQYISLQI